MPSPRVTTMLLYLGAAGLLPMLALSVAVLDFNAAAAAYSIPFAGAFAAGTLAYRAQPDNLAARRLLALGTTAVWWTVMNFALLLLYDAWGDSTWLVAPNALALAGDLVFTTTVLAVLVSYPGGPVRRRYERRLLAGGYWMALAVPVAALVSAQPAVPAAVLGWNESLLGVAEIHNPLALGQLSWLAEPLAAYAMAVFAVVPLVATVALVRNYRQAGPLERRRFKWLAVAVAAFAVTPAVDGLVDVGLFSDVFASAIEILCLSSIPALIAIGIARPDLLDVNVVIRRSVVYGALWVAIAAVYVGLAAALGLAAGSAGIQLAVAVTLVATLLLGPAYDRLQAVAAKRVYGEREQLRISLSQARKRADELAASRARIVAAEEAARRKIERDIHDGIQQELIALVAKIGLAQTQLDRDPDRLDATLADLQSEAQQAVADLRELASGIHPSVLSDRGVVEAIETRASRLPLGVTVECDPSMRTRRFGEAVEGAIYYLVCEGFGNALKHSGAERVFVRLSCDKREVEVEVFDDGRGFDQAQASRSGLDGLADRFDALGGVFAVRSEPGAGTTLSARLRIDEPVRA